MASLDLHPTDPKFPPRTVIHAMCAVGSLYTGGLLTAGNISDSYPCAYNSYRLMSCTHLRIQSMP